EKLAALCGGRRYIRGVRCDLCGVSSRHRAPAIEDGEQMAANQFSRGHSSSSSSSSTVHHGAGPLEPKRDHNITSGDAALSTSTSTSS
ncbi:unnamed protein product, partial [Amoebophrya sp. A25]